MYKDNQERVDAYIRGEMNADEKRQFESDLRSDSVLGKTYSKTKAISDAIADRKEKLNLMAEWDKEGKRRLFRKRMLRWSIGTGAAACIAAGFLLLRPLIYMSSSPSAVAYHACYSDRGYYRGGDSSIERVDSFINALEYAEALRLSDYIIKDKVILLARYEAKDSISEKESYHKMQVENELYELEWRKANILIAMGKTDEAKVLLKNLASTKNAYTAKADSLLKTIK